ncbi:DUF4493 domain-containing protein [Bacteroides fragilis]|uniref:DUF4493 domain-containing protein n=1 Tax=Bacteroides fragilis TaxID=817 RepID=UPI00203096B7|nr:DUF4493 domain-containing protein [Bacteroides fragilis]MCM0238543.1 DUF4493 domain-containing protein [Bacteroides fragilis]
MNAIRNIYAVLALIALCLSSCEMKNELEGKYNLKNDEGLLTLDLVNKTQATPSTKAESTSLTDELDVNTYKVEIVDNATEAVVRSFASYAKLKEALPLVVPVGNYKIVAKSGVLQDASRTPYFEGSSSIEVKQGMESKAEVLCKSATVKVSLNVSDEFLNMFADDYVFTVSNGIGGVIYVKKEDLGSIYLSIPNGATSIKIVAKVTEKETGRDIETIYTVTKPDEEGLEGGDSFNVTVKPVEEGEDPEDPDVTPSDPKLGIQLDIDLTMDETGITVKVPTELIEESKPEEPDQPTDPDQPTVDGPEIIGADEVVEVDASGDTPTVQLTIKASAGIKNLYVTIDSQSEAFMEIINGMGLGETFDLVNPGDLEEILGGDGVDQGGDGLGLIDPSDPIEGKQEFVFDISGFMTMLPAFGNYQHYFTIKIVDEKNNTIEKKLTVEIINANV